MLRSILFVIGAVNAIHSEEPSVHDMIQNAIHAQTKSKDNDDLGIATGSIPSDDYLSPAVAQVADQIVE